MCVCVSRQSALHIAEHIPPRASSERRGAGEWSGIPLEQNCDENIWFWHNGVLLRRDEPCPAISTSLSCVSRSVSCWSG